MYDIVGKRNWYFALSALITIPGLIFVLLGGLQPSVDFTGGTVWEVRFASSPAPEEVEAAFVELGYPDTQVRPASDGYLEIRTEPLDLIPPGGPEVSPLPSGSPVLEPSPAASGSPEESPIPSGSEAAAPVPSASPNAEPATCSPAAGRSWRARTSASSPSTSRRAWRSWATARRSGCGACFSHQERRHRAQTPQSRTWGSVPVPSTRSSVQRTAPTASARCRMRRTLR